MTDLGTPRDLETVDLHIKRMEAWVRELWAVRTIDVHRSDGSISLDQHGLLGNIRNDVGAVLSRLKAQGEGASEAEPEPTEEFPTPQVEPASAEPVIEIAPRDVKEVSDFLRLVEDSKNSPVDQVALMREAAGNLAGYLEGLQYEPDPTAGVFLRPKTPLEAAQYWSRQQATWLAEKKDLEDRLAGERVRLNRLREVMKDAVARLEGAAEKTYVGDVCAEIAQVQIRLRRALGSWFYDGEPDEPDEPELTPPAYNPRSEESPEGVPAGVAATERAPAGRADPDLDEAQRLLMKSNVRFEALRRIFEFGGLTPLEIEIRDFLNKREGKDRD